MSLANNPAPIGLREEAVKSTAAVGPAVAVGGDQPSSGSPGSLIGIIVFLVLLVIGSGIAFFFIRRHFQKRRNRAGPPGSDSSQTSQTSQTSLTGKANIAA